MREYEISYIVDPSLEEDKRSEVDTKVDDNITKQGGEISTNTESIRRKLMYNVNNHRVGFMRVVQATVDPAKIEGLRTSLRKIAGMMRLSVIQTPKREDVSPAIFESSVKQQQTEPKKAAVVKPAKEITSEEVEQKIEEALEEEVK